MMPLTEFFDITPLRWSSIAASLVCGVIVGLERQLRGKPVGIRTATLIVFGTYLFIATALAVSTDASDPSRIIGQVVTGIGFLGAGVMMAKEGVVVGVTSAATIWALAAVGVCIAVIGNIVAIKMALITLGILWGVDLLEEYSSNLTRGVHSRYAGWRRRNSDRDDGSEGKGG